MGIRSLLLSLTTGLGLCVLAAAPATDRADEPDAAKIARLVAQLGSPDFDAREKATTELDAIGEPALDALRQAVKNTDAEVRMRAESLVRKIDKRLESLIPMRAKHVHLVFKDTPVKDAVEAFRKQSGYDLVLHVADDKLKGRTVTLDTGDVTFWQAFGAFCEKAGLKEGELRDLLSLRPSYSYSPAGALIAVEQITLIDGKPEGGRTDAASAVRLLSLAPPVTDAKADDVPVALLLSLEPRLQWLNIDKTTVAKALDDKEQDLVLDTTDVTPQNPASMPPFITVADGDFIGGGIYRQVVIHLKKGPKAGQRLKLFQGTITAKVLGEMSAIISAPNVLGAGGKTFRGGEDGLLKVIEVTRNENGRISVRLELHPPSGVVPPNGDGVPAGVAKGKAAVPDGRFMGPGFGWGTPNYNGLGLMDDKGNNVTWVGGGLLEVRGEQTPAGKITRFIRTMVFQVDKGQEPSELVFCGRKILTVEIPFTLKDVPLP